MAAPPALEGRFSYFQVGPDLSDVGYFPELYFQIPDFQYFQHTPKRVVAGRPARPTRFRGIDQEIPDPVEVFDVEEWLENIRRDDDEILIIQN